MKCDCVVIGFIQRFEIYEAKFVGNGLPCEN
jgi:hypothetical protein